MGATSNLSELTVTCSQCGSASMERLGPREYRCNHCGAITVVSQDPVHVAPGAPAGPPPIRHAGDGGPSIVGVYPGPPVGAKVTVSPTTKIVGWLIASIVAISIAGKTVTSCNTSPTTSGQKPSAEQRKLVVPPVPVKQLALSPPAWMTDPTSGVSSGKYVSMLYNHSPWPITVPRYSMTLYTDGIRGASATSEAPMARLLPGEYEPVSFAFETPNGSTRTEITPPNSAERADGASVSLPLTDMQLVWEPEKLDYRVVGLVQNSGKSAVKSVQVLVMLFGANRTLVGYGTGYGRAMRPGEQAAIDVHIPTVNVQPVLRYEYLVDATAEDE